MVEEQVGAGNPISDTSADNQAQGVDDKQEHVGLTTSSMVKAADMKDSLTPDQKRQANIDKRIGKLVGQKHSLEEENNSLRERVAVLESKVTEKSDSGEKKYSTAQLETAYKKSLEDGNHDLAFEVMTQMSKNHAESVLAEYKKGTESQAVAQTRRQQELAVLGQDFPALRDNGSLLSMTTEKILQARPDLKKQDVQGYYRAATLAQQIIHEEGGDISASAANRANKKDMKNSLGAGDVSGDEADQALKSEEQEKDDYIAARQKHKEELFKEIDAAATGKSMRGK